MFSCSALSRRCAEIDTTNCALWFMAVVMILLAANFTCLSFISAFVKVVMISLHGTLRRDLKTRHSSSAVLTGPFRLQLSRSHWIFLVWTSVSFGLALRILMRNRARMMFIGSRGTPTTSLCSTSAASASPASSTSSVFWGCSSLLAAGTTTSSDLLRDESGFSSVVASGSGFVSVGFASACSTWAGSSMVLGLGLGLWSCEFSIEFAPAFAPVFVAAIFFFLCFLRFFFSDFLSMGNRLPILLILAFCRRWGFLVPLSSLVEGGTAQLHMTPTIAPMVT
mmetsp:Transcript_20704/g.41795  ORF Transcript_20704/g.41795 Transcript_20704/m.41795 type:complete len:280 (-) Transcript_20704:220-1059(-)